MLRPKYRSRKLTHYLMSLPSASDTAMASRVGSETPTSSILSASESGTCHESRLSPVFLPVGAAVSAKYRGAFCEALIERVDLNYRIRVQLKKKKACVTVEKTNVISGNIEPNSDVSVLIKSGEYASPDPQTATIIRITDLSLYTVVFDDGDKRSLKRAQLVLKGERHFKESESLDRLPLTNPEQFKHPVIDRSRRYQSSLEDEDEADDEMRPRRNDFLQDLTEEVGENENGDEDSTALADEDAAEAATSQTSQKSKKTSSIRNGTRKKIESATSASTAYNDDTAPGSDEGRESDDEYRRLLGTLVMIDMPIGSKNDISHNSSTGDASAPQSRRRYTPGLVVLPTAQPSIDLKASQISPKEIVYLVKSFRENRFYAVPRSFLEPLSRDRVVELAHQNPSLRTAFEKAILWLDRRELPSNWGTDLESLLGPNWQSENNSEDDTAGPSSNPRHSGKKSHTRRRHRSSTSSRSGSPSCSASSYSASSDSTTTSTEASDSDRERAKRNSRTSKPIKRRQMNQRKTSSASEGSATRDGNEIERSDSSDEEDSDSDASKGSKAPEHFEKRDRWIAKFYSLMDTRRTPINKGPCIANKDLDLYKLFKKVRQLGGYQRVTNQLQWGSVYSEMNLPAGYTSGPRALQLAFKKYLLPIDDLSRKLGTTLDELPISWPRKSKTMATSSLTTGETPKTSATTTPSGGTQTSKTMTKTDETKRGTSQRRASVAKSDKSAKTVDSRTKTSAGPGPSTFKPPSIGMKKSPSSTDSSSQKKDRKNITTSTSPDDAAALKHRTFRNATPPEPLLSPPSLLVSNAKKSKYRQGSGTGSGSDQTFYVEPKSSNSSPVRPTFENEAVTASDRSSPQPPIPVGTSVSVEYRGSAYPAKIIGHVLESTSSAATMAESTQGPSRILYRIHYFGYSSRNDEVVSLDRIVAINGVRRSPSCSTLNLTDRDDSRTVEMDTVSEGGDRHSKQRRSASQKQRSRPSQQRGRQGVKRPPSLSTPGWGSDFATAASTSSKKAHWATTPEESKPPTTKRTFGNVSEDSAPVKKRRLQPDSTRSSAVEIPAKTGSIVDAATSLAQSPILLKKAMSRGRKPTKRRKGEPVELKSSPPSILPALMSTSTPLKASSSTTKLGLEDISSDEDAFPPQQHHQQRQEHSTPLNRSPTNVSLNSTSGSHQSLSVTPPPPCLSPPPTPVKRIKHEAPTPITPHKPVKSPAPPQISSEHPSPTQHSGLVKSIKTSGKTAITKATSGAPRQPIQNTGNKKSARTKPEETIQSVDDLDQKITIKKEVGEEEKQLEKEIDKKAKSKRRVDESTTLEGVEENPASSFSMSKSGSAEAPPESGSSSSDEESEEDVDDDIMATSDMLPRLTRSQHRLILGDTPPGAQLLTATANPPVMAVKKEEVAEEQSYQARGVEEKDLDESDEAETTIERKAKKKKKKDEISATSPTRIQEKNKKLPSMKKKREASSKDESTFESAQVPPSSPSSSVSTLPMTCSPSRIPGPENNLSPPGPYASRFDEIFSKSSSPSAVGEEEELEEVEEEETKALRPPSRRGRSPRGAGRGGRGRRRNAPSTTVNASANDDAESVGSSNSSDMLRASKKAGRGRRGGPRTSPLSAITSPIPEDSVIGGPSAPAYVRRFGGPYFPIPNLDSLPSDVKCQVMQQNLIRVFESWKSSKEMLKAVEQRLASLAAASSISNNASTSGRCATGASGTGPKRGGLRGGGCGAGPRRRLPSVSNAE